MKTSALTKLVEQDLARPVINEAHHLAQALLDRHGSSVAAILFYGSCLRTRDAGGILDAYVLTDDLHSYHGRTVPALLNALLPPTVSYVETDSAETVVRAKVAVMSLHAFGRAVADGVDTTIWARFCQPAALLHARDEDCRRAVVGSVATAVVTAARWAISLGPERGSAADYWITLFRHTYQAELRPEDSDRGALIHDWAADRYARLLPLALTEADIPTVQDSSTPPMLHPQVSGQSRVRACHRWAYRNRMGKVLNILRLIKAALTFENGVDYVLWKLQRHSGRKIELSSRQRRHPILFSIPLLLRLRREGIISQSRKK